MSVNRLLNDGVLGTLQEVIDVMTLGQVWLVVDTKIVRSFIKQ